VSTPPFDIPIEIQRMRQLSPLARKAHLQRLIGPRTDSPLVLSYRAKLVTAMREAGLYPGESLA
jgi:hypothetical protein